VRPLNRTPWAAYDAGFYAAQAADVTAVSNAAKTNAIAQATAQKTAEVSQIDAETAWRNAYATASSVLSTGIAGANLGMATAQSLIYSAMGGSALQLPTVSRPTDLAGEYKVPGPGNTYRASISSVSSTNYYYGWWGGYWWGAWGYYGSGHWYSGYGGYGGYLYGSQVSSATGVYLAEPQMQFPGVFWQIDASTANDPWAALEVQYRYGNADGEALVAQVELPEGSFTRLPSVDTKISIGMKSVNDEVIDLMQELGDTAGDLWTLVGSINLAPLAKRISSNLAELAPELTQNELQKQSDSYSSSYLEQPVGDTSLASGAISVAPAADQSSSAVALQLVSENGELADEAETLTPEELEKAKQIAIETFAQQMLLKAAENSSAEIVQVILDQYKDNADLQNALIMMLQSYKVVTADAWWSDYWIDHETRTVYVSRKNNYYTRDAASIVGELSEAIRDDSQFYQLFGLDESWKGFSNRIGFGLLEAVGGGFTIAGGVFLAGFPEPIITKAGAVVAYAEGGNLVVAGLSSAWGRESRIDIIGSGLEKYYDVTGVDKDLRWIGRGGLLMSNLALGFVGPTTKWSSIKAFLSNSKAFAQQSLTRFQELLHSGKSIREIAKIDNVSSLLANSRIPQMVDEVAAEASRLISTLSKNAQRRSAAISKAGFGNLTSRFYTNIYVEASKFPGVQIVDNVLEITDSSKYMSKLKQLFAESGNPLHPQMESRISNYINGAGTKHDLTRGLPGLHAEVQSVNDIFNQMTKANLVIDTASLSKLKVATYKLAPLDGQGGPFVACPHCGSILESIQIITGRVK
jgi:hypothetical protein